LFIKPGHLRKKRGAKKDDVFLARRLTGEGLTFAMSRSYKNAEGGGLLLVEGPTVLLLSQWGKKGLLLKMRKGGEKEQMDSALCTRSEDTPGPFNFSDFHKRHSQNGRGKKEECKQQKGGGGL